MSRPRKSRARWDAQRGALWLPLPERVVLRAALQLGTRGLSGIEALGSWLRRFVRIAAVQPRGRPPGSARTAAGRLETLAKKELRDRLRRKKPTLKNKDSKKSL